MFIRLERDHDERLSHRLRIHSASPNTATTIAAIAAIATDTTLPAALRAAASVNAATSAATQATVSPARICLQCLRRGDLTSVPPLLHTNRT